MDRRHAIYEWFRTNRFTVDLTAAIILVLLFGPVYLLAGRPFLFLLSCCLLLPLAWRRTRPEVAAGVVVLVCLVQWAAGAEPVAGQIAVPLVIYATAAYGPAWASRAVLLLGLLGGVMLTTRSIRGRQLQASWALPSEPCTPY